jgi:23S rRNA (cytidine1920-2'-O)/16S rRNA (cytidine1409-2'-O)-methyltransferase
VAERIRTHEKVVVMERTNLRHLDGLPEPVSLVTLDLSFISVLKVSSRAGTAERRNPAPRAPRPGESNRRVGCVAAVQVLPAVCKVLSLGGDLIVLIKPQFEARRQQISRGGLVRDPSVHEEVIDKVRRRRGRLHTFILLVP